MTEDQEEEARRLYHIELELTTAAKAHGVSPLRLAAMVIAKLETRMPQLRHVEADKHIPTEAVLGTND